MKGVIVVVEGFDGSGKSTVAGLLKQHLESHCVEVITTRQPGGTPLAEDVRNILMLHPRETRNEAIEAHLFLAAREDLYLNVIKPAVDEGKVVICDRHYISSLANQSSMSPTILNHRVFEPDVLIKTSASFELCLQRGAERGDTDSFSYDSTAVKRAQFEAYQRYFSRSDVETKFEVFTTEGIFDLKRQLRTVAKAIVELQNQ